MESNLTLAIDVVAALAVILLATGLFGTLAERVGQPRVVGEMVAGVMLGPSVLGMFLPGVQTALFGPDVKGVLYVLSTIGLTFFMFLVGSSVDHGHIGKRNVRRAAAIAAGGIVPPLALGAVVAVVFHGTLAASGSGHVEFALVLGGALSVTAFPMLARILQERGLVHTEFGAMTVLAAAVDDAVAWAMLAVIVAIVGSGGSIGAVVTIGGAALFAVFMQTVVRRLLQPLARSVERSGTVGHANMAVIVLVVVACAWFTNLIGIHSIFGGFIAGVCMPQSAVLRARLQERLTDMNTILLLPVFFVFSGLNTRLGGLGSAALLLPLAVILLAAFAGKFLGCGLAARTQGVGARQSWAIGGLMNARGLMILIFVNVGMTYDVVTDQLFSILVLVAVITTAAAMPIYRATTRGTELSLGDPSRPKTGESAPAHEVNQPDADKEGVGSTTPESAAIG